jgi:superfamily I DNA and RNA helicase
MLETIIGPVRDRSGVDALLRVLTSQNWSGTLYVGYPVVALPDGPASIDALLACRERGVVVIDLYKAAATCSSEEVQARQDDLFRAVSAALLTAGHLVINRRLAVDINIVTLLPPGTSVIASNDPGVAPILATPDDFLATIQQFGPVDQATLIRVNAGIQRIGSIKATAKRAPVTRADSRGAALQRIEREIRYFDGWQKAAAIETPEGPQRIRGLAGSGKTVVLAHKAAYLHAQRPEWRIALTFYTRTLYQQFRTLVERFYYDQTREAPNWNQLQVLHAWGARDRTGVYKSIAEHVGVKVRDVTAAKAAFFKTELFAGTCGEVVSALLARGIDERGQSLVDPLWDVVLIDEAQDLPASFFEMVYLITAPPKRIVWAYDELQNLGDYEMLSPSKLFGSDGNGRPHVELPPDRPGSPRTDIILPVCYRNTPWALTTAHALGFGVYRERGLVQFFDQAELWSDIGYETVEGNIVAGQKVTLARAPEASPGIFRELLGPADAVTCEVFADAEEQAAWVAGQVRKNLTTDELSARDVLIVIATPFNFEQHVTPVIKALKREGVVGHAVGISTGPDSMFTDDTTSVPIVGIHRAKGNEAPMVYVLHAEYGAESMELIRRRNALFTAVTRSRAWVRLCGCGLPMEAIKKEVDRVVEEGYRLSLVVPTPEQLRRMRQINRDMTSDQRALVRKGTESAAALAELADQDDGLLDAALAALSPDSRERLLQALRAAREED